MSRRIQPAEHTAQLHALALQIADSTARADIETHCVGVMVDGTLWYDTRQVEATTHPEDREFVDLALAYLAERGDGAGYRTQRHAVYPHLVRFEAAS